MTTPTSISRFYEQDQDFNFRLQKTKMTEDQDVHRYQIRMPKTSETGIIPKAITFKYNDCNKK